MSSSTTTSTTITEQNKKKRVIVTGAAGFIGFHLAKHLKTRGDEVIGYDNFNSYYDVRLKRARQAELAKLGVTIVEADIADRAKLFAVCEEFKPTNFVHLAAQAGVRYSLENPDAYIESNVSGFLNVLEYCRSRKGEVPLTYASSSSVYGLNTKMPFSVDDRTDHQVVFERNSFCF